MNPGRRRLPVASVAASAVLVVACAGGLRFDARTLERRCGVAAGVDLNEEQAVCMAKLAGLEQSRRCPFEVSETTDGPAAFRVRESCSGLALSISKHDASVVVVELGRVIARYNPDSPSGDVEPEEDD